MQAKDELGCLVQNGHAPCPRCGGGWHGTNITHGAMLRALQSWRLEPSLLGCGPLEEKARRWYAAQTEPENSGPVGAGDRA